jgi:hypothetical protein
MGRKMKISPELAAIADEIRAELAAEAAPSAAQAAAAEDQSRGDRENREASEHSSLVTLLLLRERPPFDDEYVDTETLAAFFKLSTSYFAKLRVSGGGPPFLRMSTAVRYRFGDVKRWAANRFVRRSTSELDPADAA